MTTRWCSIHQAAVHDDEDCDVALLAHLGEIDDPNPESDGSMKHCRFDGWLLVVDEGGAEMLMEKLRPTETQR